MSQVDGKAFKNGSEWRMTKISVWIKGDNCMSLLRDYPKLRCRRKRGGNQRHKTPTENEVGIGEDPLVRCAEGINREMEEKSEDRGTAARPDMISSRKARLDGSKAMSRDTDQRRR